MNSERRTLSVTQLLAIAATLTAEQLALLHLNTRPDGSRSDHGRRVSCPDCHGEGEREHGIRQDSFGNWDTEMVRCSTCDGSGAA